MAIIKPEKPNVSMPSNFGGTKTEFSDSKIQSGYLEGTPDILAGDNLNFMIDTLGKNEEYIRTIVDFIRDMNIGETITVNSNNQLDYIVIDLSQKANIDSPAFTGTPTAPTPSAGENSTRIATTSFVKTVSAPIPITGSGVGQVRYQSSPNGSGQKVTLPAGGTWEWWAMRFNGGGAILIDDSTGSWTNARYGIAAGGTKVPPSGSNVVQVYAKRIA